MVDSSVIRNGTMRMQYALMAYDILTAICDKFMYWKIWLQQNRVCSDFEALFSPL